MDLSRTMLARLLKNIDGVFHLAAQPGVRASWGMSFEHYVRDNITGTQRLLEAVKDSEVKKFVYASSSSVYGDSETLPTPEGAVPRPNSPYGATKVAGELLCEVYRKNYGLPSVVLRYFSVYGPRQRPDMAFNRFVKLMSHDRTIEVYGNGSQKRDYTYVGDVVNATLLAIDAEAGSVYNVGSGMNHSLNEAISIISKLLGKDAEIRHSRPAFGDVIATSADISRIGRELGYEPTVSLEEGLRKQVSWQVGLPA